LHPTKREKFLKEAATRRGQSQTAIRQGRPSDDSSVAVSTQWRHSRTAMRQPVRPTTVTDTLDSTAAPRTAVRQLVRLGTPSVTLCRNTHSDNSNKRLLWLLSFTTNISHKYLSLDYSTRLLELSSSVLHLGY